MSRYVRIEQIVMTYRDLDVGFVDAAVLAVVERFGEPKLATLDRRHFAAVRPRHREALELLPSSDPAVQLSGQPGRRIRPAVTR